MDDIHRAPRPTNAPPSPRLYGTPNDAQAPLTAPEMDQDVGMSDRLAKPEGSYDALKVVRPMTIAVLGILMAALILC